MKSLVQILFVSLLSILVKDGYAANSGDFSKPTQKNSDTTITTTSNIVVFKMISTPTVTPTNTGSLKKAGKVARTSNSHN